MAINYADVTFILERRPICVLDRSSPNFQDRYIIIWVGTINPTFSWGSLKRCFCDNRFLAGISKIGIPHFHSVRWRMIAIWTRVLTPPMLSQCLIKKLNFAPVTPEFCTCICTGRITCWALPHISLVISSRPKTCTAKYPRVCYPSKHSCLNRDFLIKTSKTFNKISIIFICQNQ